MAEGSGLKGMVAEEVSEQLEVTELLDGGNLSDGIDGSEVGASVGRQFGEQFGREVGTAIGLKLHGAIAEGVEQEKDLGQIRSDVVSALREAIGETLEGSEVADSLGLTDEGAEAGDTEAEDGAAEGGEEAAEGGEEMAEDEEERAEDVEGDTTEEEGGEDAGEGAEGDEPSAEDLEGLRRETLEEFLSIMSYSDLQSVAKDVGVKANLSREEMTDRIVETVTESDEELAAAANEEES